MRREKLTTDDRPNATDTTTKRESAAETQKHVDEVLAFLDGHAPAFVKTAIREAIAEAARLSSDVIDFSASPDKLRLRLYRVFRQYRPAFELHATGYANPFEPTETPEPTENDWTGFDFIDGLM